MEHNRHSRHDEPPYCKRAKAYYERILQTDDVSQTEYGSTSVHLEHELCLVGCHHAPIHYTGGEVLVPPAYCGNDEVVQTSYQTGYEQRLCLRTALLAADENLCGGCCFRERILTVHVLDEILAERNHKQNSKYTAQQRREEYFEERYAHLGILCLQDIDSGQGEDGTCYDSTRAGSDTLYDDVLAQSLVALGGCRHAYGNDGDRYGSLKHLSYLQSEIGCGC